MGPCPSLSEIRDRGFSGNSVARRLLLPPRGDFRCPEAGRALVRDALWRAIFPSEIAHWRMHVSIGSYCISPARSSCHAALDQIKLRRAFGGDSISIAPPRGRSTRAIARWDPARVPPKRSSQCRTRQCFTVGGDGNGLPVDGIDLSPSRGRRPGYAQ